MNTLHVYVRADNREEWRKLLESAVGTITHQSLKSRLGHEPPDDRTPFLVCITTPRICLTIQAPDVKPSNTLLPDKPKAPFPILRLLLWSAIDLLTFWAILRLLRP